MSSDGAKLLRAAGAGDDAKVKRLLKAKADVNIGLTNLANGTSGITALHEACTYGHVGAVRLLLKAKAKVDSADSDGFSALYRACTDGHLNVTRMLLEAKAMVDAPSKKGGTPLIVAVKEINAAFGERAGELKKPAKRLGLIDMGLIHLFMM